MKLFLINVLLAFAWVLLTGDLRIGIFIEGFIISFFVLLFTRQIFSGKKYFQKFPKVVLFIFYFIKELIIANMIVAYDIITPKDKMKPGIIAFPLKAKSDLEITLLANLITLTPGTLSIDTSRDRKILFVHSMYIKDVETFKRSITEGLEKRLLEVTR